MLLLIFLKGVIIEVTQLTFAKCLGQDLVRFGRMNAVGLLYRLLLKRWLFDRRLTQTRVRLLLT